MADECNFSRAAQRLSVAQSGVSAGVRTLERELGVRLLERNSRKVALTDIGREFLPKAQAALDAARDARDMIADLRSGLRGSLRVGTLSSVDEIIDVPALLGHFHERYPRVDISLSTSPRGSEGMVEEILSGHLDISLASLPGPAPRGVKVHPLLTDPLILVVPDRHPLADRARLSINELAGESFVGFPAGWGVRSVIDRAFDDANLTRRVAFETTDMIAAAGLVRHNLGVAFLPSFAVRDRRGLRVLAVEGIELAWPLAVIHPSARSLSSAARTLLGMFADYVRGSSDAAS